MNFTKTRIWGSSLAPTPSQGEARQRGDEDLTATVRMEGTAGLPTRAADGPGDARVPVVEAHPRISPRTGTRIMNLATLFPRKGGDGEVSAALSRPAPEDRARFATRILPIEQLALLPLHAASGEADAPAKELDSPTRQAAERRGSRNVLRMVCVALAAICVVLWVASAWMPPRQAPRAPSAPGPQAVAAAVPTVAAHAHRSQGEAAAAAVELPRNALTPEPNDGLQRAAVDALVHGDEERARSLYEQLALRRGDQPAYGEAARILRARAAEPR